MSLYFHIDPPHRWVQTDRRGRPRGSGEVLALEELPAPELGGRVAVVPGELVVTRRVMVPARSRHRLLAALPYALEEDLSEDVETLHFALLHWRPGETATVAVVARAAMDDWLGRLAAAGLSVEGLVPEYLLLPLHPQATHTVARERRGLVAVRGPGLAGASFEEDLLEAWWQEAGEADPPVAAGDEALARRLVALGAGRVSHWALGDDLAGWLERGPQARPPAQLLQGDYAPRRPAGGGRLWRGAAGLLLAAFLVRGGTDAYEYWRLSREHARLTAEIEALFRRTFPEVRRVVNPRLQMRRRLAELERGSGGADLVTYLPVLARALPAVGARLESLELGTGGLRIRVALADFAALDRLKGALEAEAGWRVALAGSSAREGRVTAVFRLSRGQG